MLLLAGLEPSPSVAEVGTRSQVVVWLESANFILRNGDSLVLREARVSQVRGEESCREQLPLGTLMVRTSGGNPQAA